MRSILRNFQHGSSVVLQEVWGANERRYIVKSSSSRDGIRDLANEYQGFHWYNQFLDKKIHVEKRQFEDKYLCLKTDFLTGEKPSLALGVVRSKDVISAAISHYIDIWSRSDSKGTLRPLHGDFSLNNLIATDEGIRAIDWEHFREEGAPIGFDGLYLLFTALWFDITNKKSDDDTSIRIIAEQIDRLKEHSCLESRFEHTPLEETIAFINDNRSLWEPQLGVQPGKIPILKWPGSTSLIDSQLAKLRKNA